MLPFLMLAAPALKLIGVGEATMKWLAPVVTIVVIAGIAIGGFFLIRASDNDAVRAACNAKWEKAQDTARLEAEARGRRLAAENLKLAADLAAERAKDKAVETKIVERVRYEKAKDRVVYGGCVHTPGVRREIGQLLRTVPGSGSLGGSSEPGGLHGGPAVP